MLSKEWSDFQYNKAYNAFTVSNKEQGTLTLNALGKSLRSIILIVADIAWRCLVLNPHLGLNATQQSQGTVLIDEIDLHLHPQWQQTIIPSITKAFPNLQFIITTNSSQTLSSVESKAIRIIDNNKVYEAPTGCAGAAASRILNRVFNVPCRPQDNKNTL